MTKVKLLIIGLVVVGLGAGVTVGILRSTGQEKTPEKEAAEKVVSIKAKFIHPRKGAVERLCLQPVSVHSFERIQLFAQVAGFLKFQKVDIGDRDFKKGDVLAIVDVPDIQSQVKRNAAAVAKAQAQLSQMKSRVEFAKASLKAVEASVKQAEATQRAAVGWVNFRTIELQRMRELADSSSIEERRYDETKEKYETAIEAEIAAKAKVEITRADVVAGKAKIEQAEADVIEAKAQIEVAEADLKKTQVNLDFATIKAPFDGVVTFRSMNPGDFVRAANGGANIDPLLTVHRTDKFRMVVLVPDSDVALISIGMLATLQIDSLPGETFFPKVSRMGKTLDQHTRLMRVELDLLNNEAKKICNGMYGQITIVLDKLPEKLSIPTACVAGKIEDGKGSVYVIQKGRAKKVDLKFGIESGLRVVVEEVLTPGEVLDDTKQVIIDPSSELARPRQPEVIGTLWDDSSTIKLTQTEK